VLPGWMLPALIAGVLILALGVYFFWRRRRKRRARPLLPHEIALQRLEAIRASMQPADARAFTTAASDIVRSYIEQRFAVAVTRRTTEEFLRDLAAGNSVLARYQSQLGDFLSQCDFVKFAAMSLTTRDMEALLESARAFVLATAAPEEAAVVHEAHAALPTT
jgi:LPXTG-motif cell wall-anchored protein